MHIARAYGTPPPIRVTAMPVKAPPASGLVAARVPGGVAFNSQPAPVATSGGALSLYTRAADRVEAAVGVELGRTLDVHG